MDVTLAAIPLVVLVFQGYLQVRNLTSEYRYFDRRLRSVMREIGIAEGQFKGTIDTILSEVIEEDTRDAMLKDLESQHWQKEDLENQIGYLLGHQFQSVIDSIRGVQETLQEIKNILLRLSSKSSDGAILLQERPKSLSRLRNLLRRTNVSASGVLPVLNINPPQPETKEVHEHSARTKVTSIAKGDQEELSRLRDDLTRYNNALLATVQCCTFQKLASPIFRTSTRAHKMVGDSSCRNFPDPRVMQIASKKLYGIVSKQLACKCHLLYLLLEKHSEGASNSNDKGKRPSMVPETKFSFRLTSKPVDNHGQDATRPALHFVFINHNLEDTDPVIEACGSNFTICKELVDSDDDYQRFFHERGVNNTGFLLQRSTTQKPLATDTSLKSLISLRDLVLSRPKELTEYDRYLIAANLARSILPFYSSPWILDWTPQAIQFFERYEQSASSLSLWQPHLALQFGSQDQRQFGVRNREIYALGLMLLDLGRASPLEDNPEEEEQYVLTRALRDLLLKMGRGYTRVVENCIYVWGDRSIDLMKDKNLHGFLSDIDLLEEGVALTAPASSIKTN